MPERLSKHQDVECQIADNALLRSALRDQLKATQKREKKLKKWQDFFQRQSEIEDQYQAALRAESAISVLREAAGKLHSETDQVEHTAQLFAAKRREIEQLIPPSYLQVLSGQDGSLIQEALESRIRYLEDRLDKLYLRIEDARKKGKDTNILLQEYSVISAELNEKRKKMGVTANLGVQDGAHNGSQATVTASRRSNGLSGYRRVVASRNLPRVQEAREKVISTQRDYKETKNKGSILTRVLPGVDNLHRQQTEEVRNRHKQATNEYVASKAWTEILESPDLHTLSDEAFRERLADRLWKNLYLEDQRFIEDDIKKSQQFWLTRLSDEYHKNAVRKAAIYWGANLALGVVATGTTLGVMAPLLFYIPRLAFGALGIERPLHNWQLRQREKEISASLTDAELSNLTLRDKARRAALIYDYRVRKGILDPTDNEKRLMESMRKGFKDPVMRMEELNRVDSVDDAVTKINILLQNPGYRVYRDELERVVEREKGERVARWVIAGLGSVLGTILINRLISALDLGNGFRKLLDEFKLSGIATPSSAPLVTPQPVAAPAVPSSIPIPSPSQPFQEFSLADYTFSNPDPIMFQTTGSENWSSLDGLTHGELGKYLLGRDWNPFDGHDRALYDATFAANRELNNHRWAALYDALRTLNASDLNPQNPDLMMHFENGGYHDLATGKNIGVLARVHKIADLKRFLDTIN